MSNSLSSVREPSSAFYKSPLLVLDFQSLYPSVMIAHNYCYSTCLGRIRLFKGINQLGTKELDLPEGLLEQLSEHIHSELSQAEIFVRDSNSCISCGKRSYVRQAIRAQEFTSQDVGRTSGYSCHGEAGDEARQRRQGIGALDR